MLKTLSQPKAIMVQVAVADGKVVYVKTSPPFSSLGRDAHKSVGLSPTFQPP
jgi:hypothetical protein